MLVTTATIGNRWRNEPSDSSASATRISPWPRRAFEPNARALPPMIAVGSSPASREDHRDHRRGRGLAVAARHRDAVLDAHQLAQHLGARDDRDVARAGGRDLRVVGGARRWRRRRRRRARRSRRGGRCRCRAPSDARRRVTSLVAHVRAGDRDSPGSAAPRRCRTCRCRRCRRSGSRRRACQTREPL